MTGAFYGDRVKSVFPLAPSTIFNYPILHRVAGLHAGRPRAKVGAEVFRAGDAQPFVAGDLAHKAAPVQ